MDKNNNTKLFNYNLQKKIIENCFKIQEIHKDILDKNKKLSEIKKKQYITILKNKLLKSQICNIEDNDSLMLLINQVYRETYYQLNKIDHEYKITFKIELNKDNYKKIFKILNKCLNFKIYEFTNIKLYYDKKNYKLISIINSNKRLCIYDIETLLNLFNQKKCFNDNFFSIQEIFEEVDVNSLSMILILNNNE